MAQVSIIIRALNEGTHLERLLAGIEAQRFRDWEVVLVDSGSTDDTVAIASRHNARIVTIPKHEFTYGRALNLGCSHASGNVVVLVSAHTYPVNNSWLGNLVRPFEDATIGMVYGRQRGVDSTRIAEARDFEHYTYGETSRILIDEAMSNNANAAARKQLWEQVPFDEHLPALEDIDWARKVQALGYRVYYAADAGIHHIHDERLRQVYRRHLREAAAYKQIFHGFTYPVGAALKDFIVAIPRDVVFGLRGRMSLRKMLDIIPSRAAEYYGRYRGTAGQSRRVAGELRALPVPTQATRVLVTAPGEHRLDSHVLPPLGDDHVRIQVAFVGICATDLEVLHGELQYYKDGYARYPIVPGHEYSGAIVATGSAVRGFARGDKVVGEVALGCGTCAYCRQGQYYRCETRREVGVINWDGAYATVMDLPARHAHKLPVGLPLQQAALVEPVAVCVKGIRKLGIGPGARACVFGAGPIGNLCAQVLRSKGAYVMVVDPDERRLALATRSGVDGLHEPPDMKDYDYVVEATGNSAVLQTVVERSKPSARILVLGLPHVQRTPVAFSSVVGQDKVIYGSVASAPEDWDEAIRLVAGGALRLDDFTRAVLPLERYADAWELQQRREHLKVMLNPTPSLAGL